MRLKLCGSGYTLILSRNPTCSTGSMGNKLSNNYATNLLEIENEKSLSEMLCYPTIDAEKSYRFKGDIIILISLQTKLVQV